MIYEPHRIIGEAPQFLEDLKVYLETVEQNTVKGRYKVVQICPGQTVTCLHTNSPTDI
jgi:hypothetical protein